VTENVTVYKENTLASFRPRPQPTTQLKYAFKTSFAVDLPVVISDNEPNENGVSLTVDGLWWKLSVDTGIKANELPLSLPPLFPSPLPPLPSFLSQNAFQLYEFVAVIFSVI
jgi:hypothetical protein